MDLATQSSKSNICAAFLPANLDACALYRMYIPHLNLPNSRFVFTPGKIPLDDFAEASVAVVQRQVTIENYAAILAMQEHKIKVIYDTDDNLWSVSADNPAAKAYADIREGFSVCASACDLITVTTPSLRSALRTQIPDLKAEILVIPNAIDFKLLRPPVVPRDDGKVIIGWAGSDTHNNDVKEAWSALPRILEENPNVYLELVGGSRPPSSIDGHPRVTYRPWLPVGEFYNRLSTWAWDISLAPLDNNRFNRSKSCIKMLEASATHCTCLASDVQPYNEFCSLGGDELKWLLVSRASEWHTKLSILIQDAARRKQIAGQMLLVARKFYDIETIREHWQHAFEVACQLK